MEVRYSVSPEEAKRFDTEQMREAFLITDLFTPNTIRVIYSHVDRIIVGGVMPKNNPLALKAGKEIGADSFLERRELGLINIGGEGTVTAGGRKHVLKFWDGLYIG